jgi:hypothetical protein
MQVHFADGITNISLTGIGLVRLEFGAVSPATAKDTSQPMVLSPTQQVVMPLDGFLRAFGAQEQVVKKLVDDGLVNRRESNKDNETK